ncbi:MAG: Npt1/Npt2 family nucleotide transporter [Vicinamibacterales bacterium]
MRPIVQLREGEATTTLLMFLYSFLAMTSYNIIKPLGRSTFMTAWGADNLPYVQLAMGILIGFIMHAYVKAISLVPRRWTIPATQAGLMALILVFWLLFTTLSRDWVPAAFYVLTLILGILLISQFWTLANDVYDPRQAKRVFGFVGAGSSLGGAMGSGLTRFLVEKVGTNTMLLIGAGTLALCLAIVVFILRREKGAGTSDAAKAVEEEGVSSGEAIQLLGSSRHLQVIALVIAFAAIGAAIIEQQLNMATALAKGVKNTTGIAAFLAEVGLYTSMIGFVINLALTSRIHRVMGIGFALLVLPMSLGSTALVMLFNRGLWAPALARVIDTSLRYSLDKTSREVLFLPLPANLKYRAKPFIDVTVDRISKGLGALLILVLIKDWGLGLSWQQLSYASLTMVGLWVVTTIRARKEYIRTFRNNLEHQNVVPSEVKFTNPDPATVEALVQELANPEPRRALYAIDLLDAMDKRSLVTPLLLWHTSPEIRARALRVAETAGPAMADRWLPGVETALTDSQANVRVAAVRALAALRGEAVADVMRPFLGNTDPALVIVAAAALADSHTPVDVDLALQTLRGFACDTRDQAVEARRLVARALGDIRNSGFRSQLVPLMYDANISVARAAVESAGKLGATDFLFVAPLVSLLRNRMLKSSARQVLVGYGAPVVAPLAYFMQDREEDVWVRRHVPSALALLACAESVAALEASLDDPDEFLRSKAVSALGRIRETHPALLPGEERISKHVSAECSRAFDALTLHYNLFVAGGLNADALLARALTEKYERTLDRALQLLGLMTTSGDVAAVRQTLTSADPRARSGAIEYLDNLVKGQVRKRVMVLIDEMPLEERIRKGNAIYGTRIRDVEDTVAQLIHDQDESIASAAILLIEAHRLWSLAGDLEYVLSHRDVRDLHVFEASSWALAASRMESAQRLDLWQEALPSVELADRLRRMPMFRFTCVDELFRLARVGRQVRYETGHMLYERGAAAASLQFVLDGQVVCEGPHGRQALDAPAALGFEEILEGTPMDASVTATSRVATLSMTPDEFLAVLSENVDLSQGLFRQLITERGLDTGHTVVRGNRSGLAGVTPGELRAVDRLLVLQASPLLAHATAAQLWSLSQIARQVTLAAGAEALKLDAEAALLFVVTGTLRVDGSTAGPGDVIGMHETLAGSRLDAPVIVVEAACMLKLDRRELFEVLADHTDLLQGLFSKLVRRP